MSYDTFDLEGPRLVWPIPDGSLIRVGQSVLADRDGRGRPHYGVDLYAAEDTPVLAAAPGRVLLVHDGRGSTEIKKLRAGLWIEIGADGLVYRYMHLSSTVKTAGQRVGRGALLGFVGPNARGPHLHFEVRRGTTQGAAIDPLKLLPQRRGSNERV